MTFRSDTAATLRRRAKALLKLPQAYEAGATIAMLEAALHEHCTPERVAVFERAADELEAHRRACGPSGAEAEALRQLGDNRRLRKALAELIELVELVNVPAAVRTRVEGIVLRAFNTAKPLGQDRMLLVLEVLPGQRRQDLEAAMATLLDAHFLEGATHVSVDTPVPAAPASSQPVQED